LNGDLGKIYELVNEVKQNVAVIEERQRNNHAENKDKLTKVENLKCETHSEKLNSISIGLKTLYTIVIAVLLIWVKVALAK